MEAFKYPNLFSPIRLGNTLFRNRIFAAPTGYQNTDTSGEMPQEAAYFYARKAMGGAASVSTGELIVDSEIGRGSIRHCCIDNPNTYMGLCRVANAITRYGAVATAELQHAGMYANRELSFFGAKARGEAYGPVECEVAGRTILPMDEDMIQATIQKYAQAAATAKRAGFGMILIHGGHGWMLQQWLSPYVNTRTDKWGGAPVENRARLAVEICDAIRREVGPGFPIEFRMSGSECYEGGYGIEEGIAIAKQLEGHVDLIHVSAGSHEVKEVFTVTHPRMFLGEGPNVQYAAEIKKHVKTPVATIGALGDPEMLEEIIASGKADVVEMARSLIADPDLPTKARIGKEDEIRPCMRCLYCFTNEILRGEKYCAINPEVGYESEYKHEFPKAPVPKKVLIAGAGIGGMQAAITCAKRGHQVILCEKTDEFGGKIRCEKDVPFKRNLDRYIQLQKRTILKDENIEVRLNTAVTPEYAESVGADVIIAALGTHPLVPRIPGIDRSGVLVSEYAYTHPEEIGQNVIILGAGLVGLELADYLALLGRKVTVVEMQPQINDGGNFLHAEGLMLELENHGVAVHLNTKAVEITGRGVQCETKEGTVFYEADTVIHALGQVPLQEEALALQFCAPEFYMLGDCVAPKTIGNATATAFEIANNIGRI